MEKELESNRQKSALELEKETEVVEERAHSPDINGNTHRRLQGDEQSAEALATDLKNDMASGGLVLDNSPLGDW